MAANERLEALNKVRAARSDAEEARSDQSLAPAQLGVLEELCVDLGIQEDILILESIDARLDDLRAANGRLEETAQKLQTEIDRLQKVADVVGTAAKAVKIVADLAKGAGNLGIL